MADQILLVFAIVVSIILFAPFVFGRFKLPLISSLILAAIIVGPHGLQAVELTSELEYIGLLGLLFLLFLAGIEVAPIKFDQNFRYSLILAICSFSFSFSAGCLIGYIFDFVFVKAAELVFIFVAKKL